MEDRALWQRHLADLQGMEAEGGRMAQMDLTLLEAQVDGDHPDIGEDHLGCLLARQVAEHLRQVRRVSLGDRREDQGGLLTDLQMDLRMDLRMGRPVDPATDHLDPLMDHPVAGRAVVVVDHPEDLLVEMDQEQGP